MYICSPQLGLSPQSVLGGEIYDMEMLKRFARKGHIIEILLPKNRAYDTSITTYRVENTHFQHFVPPHLYNTFLFPYVIRKIREKKCDIFRIHVPEFFGPSVWIIKKLYPQIPIVGHYHLDESGFLFNAINKVCLSSYNLIIADSHYLKREIMKKFFVEEQHVKVVHCGTDIKKLKPGKKCRQIIIKYGLQNKVTLLFLGLFIERKKPHFLLDVLERILKKNSNVALIMIGKGPLEQSLKKRVKQTGLARFVHFPGPQYDCDKLAFYQTADIFTFPSQNEGFVLVVLEAMASGLPIVVPRAVSFPEAVEEGENGFLVKSNSLVEWEEKLLELITNERLRQHMKVQSRRIAVKKFSWEICAEKTIRYYKRCVGKQNM